MFANYNFAILLVLLGALWWFIRGRITLNRRHKLPPGPRGLPIIGSLHLLGNLPHRALHKLSQKYGPIMSMRLGNVQAIVVSSPRAAKLFLKTHDTIFASRPNVQAGRYVAYGNKGVAFTEYGPYWRNVRKFCTLELLSVKKIDSLAGMRREELVLMVKNIKEAAKAREVSDISDIVGRAIENMTYRMLFGRSKDDRFDLKSTMQELMDQAGSFNIADYVPWLGPLDIQGLTRRIKAMHSSVDKILEIIIREHEEAANNSRHKEKGMDFVDILLSLMEKSTHRHDELSEIIDRQSIKGIIIDMIAAGIDTSHTGIEWIMTELIRHPRVMKQLQEEIKTGLGIKEIVEETDLIKFKYLDMVIKESFRLHPVIPLLIPHESMEDIVINGYYIPRKSRIFINSWALGRDPSVWSENVEDFLPERFTDKNIDFRGHDFELLPFGSGRRMCPGMHLGLINVRQIVAQLVHSFDWELPNGMSTSDLDMSEKFGLSLPRATRLGAVPTLRL